jgi:hypothetical protein
VNEAIGRFHLESAIEQAKTRNARRAAQQLKERAAQVREGAAEFIVERPFTAVAAGVAVGLLIGALLPRPRFGKTAGALAGVVAKAGIDYGRQAFERALHAYKLRTNAEGGDNTIITEDSASPSGPIKRLLPERFKR